MIKFILILSIFFINFSSFSLTQKTYQLAQAVFDESDLESIENSEQDDLLEKEFNASNSQDESDDNFYEEDYEQVNDYSDYEIVSDSEIEKDFDGKSKTSKQDLTDDASLDESLDTNSEDDSTNAEDVKIDFEEEEASSQLKSTIENDKTPEQEDVTESEEATENDEALVIETAPEQEDLTESESATEIPESMQKQEDVTESEEAIENDEAPVTEDLPEQEDLTESESATENDEVSVTEDVPEQEDLAESIENNANLNLITNIRYISAKDHILINSNEIISYNTKRNIQNNQLIIEIQQAKLSKNLHWPYVLKDFNTNFGMIKADQKTADTVRIIIQLKKSNNFPVVNLSEASDQIIVSYFKTSNKEDSQALFAAEHNESSILPAKTLEDLYSGNVKFSGFPISFHVIDTPIKQVLRFISEESGLNMVIGESVTGTVTLKLENIPWDQALYTIFKVKSLGYTRDGSVITILPLKEIEDRTRKLKQIAIQKKSLSPYIIKSIPINFGKMSDIESKVKQFSSKKTDTKEGGQIITHQESNTFVVIDTKEVVKKIESIVRFLDKAPKQVLVEARIVEAQESFTKTLGINWDIKGNLPISLNTSGFLQASDFLNPAAYLKTAQSLVGNISGDFSFDNANQTSVASLNLNGLPIIGDLKASLDLAEINNYAQVISTPKVIVISGKSASITRNSPILVSKSVNTTTTADGSTSQQSALETLDVKIDLQVTPTVTPSGSVFLDINVTKTDPAAGSGQAGGGLVTSRTAKTSVLVKNGQTIVIGGIYEKIEGKDSKNIPFIKHIPIINVLFGTGSKNISKSELLIFITPKLLNTHEAS